MSSWAYQSLDCALSWVQQINRHAPWPDLTLLLDVPAAVALRRVAERKGTPEIYENLPMQERLAEAYTAFAHDPALEAVHRIDGTLEREAITPLLMEACIALGL